MCSAGDGSDNRFLRQYYFSAEIGSSGYSEMAAHNLGSLTLVAQKGIVSDSDFRSTANSDVPEKESRGEDATLKSMPRRIWAI